MNLVSISKALVTLGLFGTMIAPPAVAQGVSTRETDEPEPQLLGAAIEEPVVDVGSVRGRSVSLWIEVPGTPECDGVREYGFLFDPLEDRHALPDSARPFTPDARLAIRCDPSTDRWSSSFGDLTVGSGEEVTRFNVFAPVEDLPKVDLLWVAYVARGGRAWFLPDPGPEATGLSARFSIYEIAKP
jgi:hypothetical protein